MKEERLNALRAKVRLAIVFAIAAAGSLLLSGTPVAHAATTRHVGHEYALLANALVRAGRMREAFADLATRLGIPTADAARKRYARCLARLRSEA